METCLQPFCSKEQQEKQDKVVCDHFVGRHNLDEFLAYVGYHVPEASTSLDVGGNKGLFSARIFELWRPEFNISSKGYARECVTSLFLEDRISFSQLLRCDQHVP